MSVFRPDILRIILRIMKIDVRYKHFQVYNLFLCVLVVFINTVCFVWLTLIQCGGRFLTSEAVECAALSLERMHYIESSDRLATCVLCVCDSVTDDVFEEDF